MRHFLALAYAPRSPSERMESDSVGQALVSSSNMPGLLSGSLTTRLVVLGGVVELLHFFGAVLQVAAPFSLLAGPHALLDYFNDLLVHFTGE